ncbi:unnamed protein product [Hymenolepis diminuta]|uniref:Uncharacterized protein n=1 Tax=Hymenolepis diminuta TaxID=6216 RepID=A0A564YZ17_HYMDI|nr:unnamed protein product [Hymenolepis diminuta]
MGRANLVDSSEKPCGQASTKKVPTLGCFEKPHKFSQPETSSEFSGTNRKQKESLHNVMFKENQSRRQVRLWFDRDGMTKTANRNNPSLEM